MKKASILVLLLAVLASPATAAQSGCPQHFLDGHQPTVTNALLLNGAKELCYIAFGVVHSGRTRTPLWVGEHMSAAQVSAAKGLEREDVFVAEAALDASERSELSDYARSGYDRGHLAPAADMSSPEAMAESFTLANIVPQTADSNRGIWSDVEWAVRDLARDAGEVYVVTGPLYLSDRLTAIGAGVVVPTHMFKAVYVPSTGIAAAYVVENDHSPRWETISIARLAELAGFDPFPTLSNDAKATAGRLPRP